MSRKTVHLIRNGILKPFRKCDRQDHGHHADGSRRDGQPDNKPGKGMLAVESDTPGNKTGNIQSELFTSQK